MDAGYYRFPERRYLEGMMSQVPDDFLFSFKVTDEITVKKFTNQRRYGQRAGKSNENFLNADLFAKAFVEPFEEYKQKVGLFIFEFSKFYPRDYEHGLHFVADLDKFLFNIPKGWPYGVEIRNKYFLKPEYFNVLKRHGVAHVFNSWTEMPSVGEQLALADSVTNPDLVGARFLLKPGREYEEAVNLFGEYEKIKEPYPEARTAAAELIQRAMDKLLIRRLFLYVNNRLEGNALETINEMLKRAIAMGY